MRCGVRGKRSSSAPIGDAGKDLLAQGDPVGAHRELALEASAEQIEAPGDVADDFGLREIHLFDGRGHEADVNDPVLPARHQERRLLDRFVADGDDEIGAVDRLVDVIAFTQGRGADIIVRRAADGALAHLRIEKWDADAADEFGQRRRQLRAAGAGAEHQQRTFRGQDQLGRARDRLGRRYRQLRFMGRHQRDVAGFLGGDVFGQFEMHRAGTLFGGDAEGVAHQRRNRRGTHDLLRLFCQGTHRRHDIDDLEMRLRALANGLLAGDHDHRHAAEKTVGGTGDKVERAGTERGKRNARSSRQPSIGRGQESGRLLMARHHEFDGEAPQALDDVEILLPGHSEDSIDALVLERGDEKIRSLHVRFPLWIQQPQFRIPRTCEVSPFERELQAGLPGMTSHTPRGRRCKIARSAAPPSRPPSLILVKRCRGRAAYKNKLLRGRLRDAPREVQF